MSAAGERPTGTVTFLFSDIEGSTRLLQRLGGLYGQALAEHQRLLREAFEAHGGHEIDTQGDSFFVAFRRAKDAVAAAVAGQRALAEYEWPDGAELRVRMGIHTGEPTDGEGRYVGLGVHRAARIGAAAVGGQVLVSESTRALLRDDPLPDITLRDLGSHRLKDIDEPERLFELDAPGLVHADPGGATGRVSRKRLVAGGLLVAAVAAAGLGTFLSREGGTAGAATVKPNEVGVIDTKNGHITGSVPVGSAPNGVAAGDGAIWVANTDDNSVARVDPSTKTVRQTIPVGGSPAGVAVSRNAVWVANAADGTVSRIDPSTNTVVDTKDVGNGPTGIAYGDGTVWVANSADGTISRLDASSGEVEKTLPGVAGVTGLTVAFGHVWAVAPASGHVIELGAGSPKKIGVGHDPYAVTAAAGSIWVANRQDGTVSRIDPRVGQTALITVGHAPVALAPAGRSVWVANSGDGTLWEIDTKTNSVVNTLSLANPPQGIASSGTDLYVSVRSSGAANRGGTLRVVQPGAPDFLDPAYAYNPVSWSTLPMTNDGLVGFRRVGGAEGTQLVPDLATSIPAPSDGGRIYTFTLRKGIRYSTGQQVEPEDIKAAIERLLSASNPIPPPRTYFTSTIVGASRCSPGKPCDLSRGIVTNRAARTITFHLTGIDPDFLTKLAMPVAYAVPTGTPARVQSGVPATGPYRIGLYEPKQRVMRLVRNKKFAQWSQDAQPAGFPDAIEVTWPPDTLTPDQSYTRLTRAVEQRQADVGVFPGSPPVPEQTLKRLKTQYRSQLRLILAPATWYVFLNARQPPFDDVRVRRAVAIALDRAAFGRLLSSEYTPTCTILPPGYPGYQRGCPYGGAQTERLRRARALVQASGASGAHIVFWSPGPVTSQGRYAVSLLNSLGFHASLHAVPASQIVPKYFSAILDPHKHIQAGYIGWIGDYPSSLAFFQQQLSCKGLTDDVETNTNVSEFCDRRIDAEIDRAARMQVLDPPKATLLWQKVGRDLLAASPMVPTYNGRAIVFLGKRVGNFQYHPQWMTLLDQLWVK